MIRGTPSPGDTSDRSASALAAKRETLTSRAKRIIGKALETPKENGGSGKESTSPNLIPIALVPFCLFIADGKSSYTQRATQENSNKTPRASFTGSKVSLYLNDISDGSRLAHSRHLSSFLCSSL